MGITITNLVTAMLFSDCIIQRLDIAKSIIEQLNNHTYRSGEIANAVRAHFENRIKACAVHPSSNHHHSIFELAKFYDIHAEDFISELPEAA